MKQTLVYLFMAAGIMMLGACKEKKQTGDVIITEKYEPKDLQAPIRMDDQRQESTVEWQGQNYQVIVSRTADDTQPMLKDDNGQEYVDNKVTVDIRRGDGSSFFQHTFTKAAFASFVDEPFKRNGQLAGIRFDEVDKSAMEFDVVIALPDAVDDLFVPLDLVVDRQGTVRVEVNNDMDMLDYETDDDVDDIDD